LVGVVVSNAHEAPEGGGPNGLLVHLIVRRAVVVVGSWSDLSDQS
jgi:hypothetical protein